MTELIQKYLQSELSFDAIVQKGEHMSERKIYAGIAEAGLLLIYFFWNLRQVRNLRKSKMETMDQLRFMSYWDELTSLYNRNKYMQLLDENRQKQLNDQNGHDAGDTLICAAAGIIREIYPENAYRKCKNLEELLEEADKCMYEEKNLYHKHIFDNKN